MATYTFDFGRPIPSVASPAEVSKGMIWNLVHQLTGRIGGLVSGIWTCEGSCDGIEAAMDGFNRWWNAGTFNPALLVQGATYTAVHSWMTIKSPNSFPGGPIWITFDYTMPVAGGTDYGTGMFSVWVSTTAPTGGSTTARPTAPTSEIGLYYARASFYGGERMSMYFGDGTTTSRKCSLILADDGAFLWGANKSSALLSCGFGAWPLLDTDAADGRPFTIIQAPDMANYAGASAYPWRLQDENSAAGVNLGSVFSLAGLLKALWFPAGTGTQYATTARVMWGFASTGGASTSSLGYTPLAPSVMRDLPNGFIPTDNRVHQDPAFVNSFTLDRIRNRYIDMPVYLKTAWAPSSAYNSIRGKLRDISWGLGISEGTNDPVGTDPITRVTWGDLWVPSPDAVWSP